jgi:hypothetical protein
VPYQTIAYDQVIPIAMRIDQTFEADLHANVNAIRFVTQNVLTVDMDRQKAITWANQCLVLPLESPFRCQPGETLHLTANYEAGQQIEFVKYDVSDLRSRDRRRAA